MTYRSQTRHWFGWCGALGLIALLAATPARSQGTIGGFAPLGSGTVLPRNTSFLKSPGTVRGLHAFAPASIDIEVQGPSGLTISIKSIESMSLPGGKHAYDVFELVDVDAPPPAASTSTASTASTSPQPVGVPVRETVPADLTPATESNLATIVTVRKKLLFKGLDKAALSRPDTFFRAIDVELQAGRVGTSGATMKTTFVLTNDHTAPTIVTNSSEPSSNANFGSDDFPSVVRATDGIKRTFNHNYVDLHSALVIYAREFSVIRDHPTQRFKDFYQVVAVYDDGAKFAYDYERVDATNPSGAIGIKAYIPNIGRGGFRVELRTPFGRAAATNRHSFGPNLFVDNLPIARGAISVINRDSPMFAVTEDDLWPPAHFSPAAFPSHKTCDVIYGEWESVTLGDVSKRPLGVASAKFTRTPSQGSLANNGNMPQFSCTSAGLGSIEARWTAKIRMYVGECPDRRVPD